MTTNITRSEPRTQRTPTVARSRARKEIRRKRELALSLAFVAAAIFFDEPALILISVFPALASYGQR